jgi:hypothetical protein
MPYMVGERRPELFVPGHDGAIVPRIGRPLSAAAMAALLAAPTPAAASPARGGAPVLHANITINAPGGDAGNIRQQVEQALHDLMRRLEFEQRTALND